MKHILIYRGEASSEPAKVYCGKLYSEIWNTDGATADQPSCFRHLGDDELCQDCVAARPGTAKVIAQHRKKYKKVA